MANHGVYTAENEHGVWCWVGVRVDAAADLTETREYADLPEPARYLKAVQAETSWIAGQWETTGHTRIDLRYLGDPGADATGGSRLRCAVLGRVFGRRPDEVHAAALHLRERLADLPRHVHCSAITDPDEVAGWLAPFTPHPCGLVDIRKRIHAGRPTRPDAGVAHYLAVEPWTASAPPWEPLYRALAAHPYPLMLSVGLQPLTVPPGFTTFMYEVTTQYTRLGTRGRLPDGLWSSGVELAPDAFAVDAARLYADASRRYASRAFRARVSLACAGPIPDALANLVGAVVSPQRRPDDEAALAATHQATAHVAVRPYRPEFDVAWRNITTLDHARWDGQYAGTVPVAPPDGVRLLAELVDPREASAVARLPLAVHGHMPGFPVRRPGLALEAVYAPRGPHLRLGRQLVADRPAAPVGIDLPDLTRHALFVGTTGSGKTNTTLAFCEQLWRDHRIPFLVIEPVNTTLDDYRWLPTRPGMDDLVVLTVGNDEVAPLRLNPFEVPQGVRVGSHIAGLLACFDAAFGLWDPLPAIYNRALRATYTRRGIVHTELAGPRHQGNWPTLGDFVARMREATEKLDYAGEVRSNIIAASRLRAESLADGACGSTLDCAASYPVGELLRRPVVVELAEVGDNEKEQSLLTALILQTMTEYYKAGRAGGGLTHVTVIEEAHRLLGRPVPAHGDAKEANAQARAAQSFANSLAENRKYGEGLVIVEQVPSKLIEDAYKNTNLKVMHRLPAEDDRRTIGATMRFSADQERYAATLEPFTAFAYHDGLDRPALVRMPNVRAEAASAEGLSQARLAGDVDLAERFAELTRQVPAIGAAVAPFVECEGCRHRCAFRAHAAAAVGPEPAAELKTRVKAYPTTVATQREWWRSVRGWVRGLADAIPRQTSTTDERDGYEACVFVHLVRLAWRRDGLPWVRLYRKHSEEARSKESQEEVTAP